MNPGGDVLVTGGLFVGEEDGFPQSVQEGGSAAGQVGGACYYHLHTLYLLIRRERGGGG